MLLVASAYRVYISKHVGRNTYETKKADTFSTRAAATKEADKSDATSGGHHEKRPAVDGDDVSGEQR